MINNKKGLSPVVATVLIIGLTVATGAVIWAVISNLVGQELEEGEACFGVLDQVKLNRDYTCYNSTANIVQFSLSVGDIDIDGILVSVSYAGTSKGVTLTSAEQNISDVKNYPDGSDGVKMPNKNAGATYLFYGINVKPISVVIIPIIKGNQCGSTDSLREIIDCRSLVN